MSFDEVYKKHYYELRRFGRQLNLTVERSEDLTQETFLRYFLELQKDVVFDNPRAWLYKVLLNLFRADNTSKHIEYCDSDTLVCYNNRSDDPDEADSGAEKMRIVQEIIDSLPKRDKEILLLYHNGFTYAEMADILGINPNSVGKTLVRAIEKLKNKIKTQYHEMFEQG
jgi:RNA polymerase sigma-70 factor, ECF subfamily